MVRRSRVARRAVAAVELAVLLPFLAVILVIAVDWSRLFYYSLTIENCARNGALYASDPYSGYLSSYATITDAALADATNLTPSPSVSSSSGTDADNHSYVECTVTYNFKTVTNLPLVGKSTTLQRTVRMYTVVQLPN